MPHCTMGLNSHALASTQWMQATGTSDDTRRRLSWQSKVKVNEGIVKEDRRHTLCLVSYCSTERELCVEIGGASTEKTATVGEWDNVKM
jgi:hypothetical protein